jgi:hypothetical protein
MGQLSQSKQTFIATFDWVFSPAAIPCSKNFPRQPSLAANFIPSAIMFLNAEGHILPHTQLLLDPSQAK